MPVVRENMKKVVDQTKNIFNNGLANVRVQAEQILSTESTIKKLIEEHEFCISQVMGSVLQMKEITKLKEISNQAMTSAMMKEIDIIKNTALSI